MNNNIHPCLWFDGNAKEAASFYCNLFNNSAITIDTPMVVNYNLCGQKFMGLNGGPIFKFNTAISFFVFTNNEADVDRLWNELSKDGKIYMPLNAYPWATKYGWCSDQFGVSWQVMQNEAYTEQTIVPSFMCSNHNAGKAKDAMQFYTSLFSDSNILLEDFYKQGEPQPVGNIKYARFSLNNKLFSIMDNAMPNSDNFNEAISFVVECNNQEEIDFYWNNFIKDGGEESRCGWCKDKFGVSWQIIPKNIFNIFSHPQNGEKSMQRLMGMNKIIIDDLINV